MQLIHYTCWICTHDHTLSLSVTLEQQPTLQLLKICSKTSTETISQRTKKNLNIEKEDNIKILQTNQAVEKKNTF